MNYLSLFSGIGGFDIAFRQAGMTCVGMVEIDKHCQDVLHRRFPDVQIYGDVKDVGAKTHERGTVDLICGGFPCQDLSVAGRRKGLAGERSGLWFEFHRIIADVKPRWVIIENVPGLLSSCGCPACAAMRRLLRIHTYLRRKRKIHQPCAICHAARKLLTSHRGRDFAIILHGLAECGYGIAWRILDAQYFGLAQRRRRVFIVGSLGSGRAAKVLFESEGMSGDSPPSRKTGARLATDVAASLRGRGPNTGTRIDAETGLVSVPEITRPLFAAMGTKWNGNGDLESSLVVAETEKFVANAFNGYTGGPDDNDAQARHIVVSRDAVPKTANGLVTDLRAGNPHISAVVVPPLRAKGGVTSSPTLNKNTSDLDFLVFAQNERDEVRDLGDVAGSIASESGMHQQNYIAYTIQQNDGGDHKRKDRPNGGMYVNEADTALTVGGTDLTAIAWEMSRADEAVRENGNVAPTLQQRMGTGGNQVPLVGVRRLTPTECERLQGFEDDWTAGQSDSVRYRQLGNAVAVPVVEWIANRIVEATP